MVIGSTIKHYVVEDTLGKGGMGVVYRARDTRLERSVALKFLPEEFTADAERKRRFFQEARAACAVNHPAIAQVYDVDEHDGAAFIVMEHVAGQTVRDLVEKRELDLLGAVEIATQVAEGLAKAHEAGIIHRDVKAENIMLTPDGHAKILDFGLAKLLEPPAQHDAEDLSHMETVARTQAGLVVGTLRYMSPEQARGHALDHRSDIFSLGVVLYEMASGELPFKGKTPLDTLHAIAFEETRPVTQVRANLPPGLQRVLSRCLRKRAEDRYGDARELIKDLHGLRREIESGVTVHIPLGERLSEGLRHLDALPGHRGLWLVAGGLGLVVALLLMAVRSGDFMSSVVVPVVLGLIAYRRVRNRSQRLMRRFAAKAARLPEVRVVAYEGHQVTVLVDRALARTYLRINTLMEAVNSSLFFGQPFTVSVRDNLDGDATRELFGGSGVVYVRKDVLDAEV